MSTTTRPDGEYEVTTDASEDEATVGAVLTQNGHPIAYESKKLNPHQKNYPVHGKENVVADALSRIHINVLLSLPDSATRNAIIKAYQQEPFGSLIKKVGERKGTHT